ncbi:hypothetical protein PAMA_000611 [Pampus argenteus]
MGVCATLWYQGIAQNGPVECDCPLVLEMEMLEEGSACSQSDDLPCCVSSIRTSATFANDNKSLFDQQRQEIPDRLRKDTPSTHWDQLSEISSDAIRINDLPHPTLATTCCDKTLQPTTTEE